MNIEIVDVPTGHYTHGKWDTFFIKLKEASAQGRACVVPDETLRTGKKVRAALFAAARGQKLNIRSSFVDGKLVVWMKPTND